jgi:hypothetical protein
MNYPDMHLKAHELIGTPFRHHGRTLAGVDCIGLVILACYAAGYRGYTEAEEFAYTKTPQTGQLREVLERHFGQPVDDEPQVNDVVLMLIGDAEVHCGIITTHPTPKRLGIIHAFGGVKKVIYHRFDSELRARVTAVYRWDK